MKRIEEIERFEEMLSAVFDAAIEARDKAQKAVEEVRGVLDAMRDRKLELLREHTREGE